MKKERKDWKELSFFVTMAKVPTVTAQEKKVRIINKNGHNIPIFYDTEKIKKAKQVFKEGLSPYVPEEPIEKKAIRLSVEWLFPLTKTALEGDWKITRPDTDNLQKMLKDIMTELKFWKDDALVCIETIEKRYSSDSGVFISLKVLN